MNYRRIFPISILFVCAAIASAQSTIPVSGAKIVDNSQQPLTGNLVFTVTNMSDAPVTYTPQGGSPTTATISIPVKNGAVQNVNGYQPQIPNPATMSPANTRYRMQVQDLSGSITFFTFPLVNITQTFFSYDGYRVPAGVTASGIGMPKIPCDPSAMYTDTKFDAPYPWVCSQLINDNSIVWTQNPSLNPICQKGNNQAIASPAQGPPYCIDATQAFATPGYVVAGPTASATLPGQIGLVPISQLCAGGACGAGGVPAAPQYAVQYAGPSAAAFNADPTFTFNTATHGLSALLTNGRYSTDVAQTGGGNNGLANLQAGPCSGGNCTPMFPATSTSTEVAMPTVSSTHVQDFRKGSQGDYFRNPVAGGGGGTNFIGSQYSGAKTFYANWDAPTLDAVSYPGQNQTVQTMFNNFSSPGFNFGSWGGPYLGPLWSLQHGISMYQNVYTQGIANMLGGQQDKYAAGDSQSGYFYNRTDGGFKDGAGEGSTGMGLHTDEHSTWFHGTANAGNASGTQLLKATYVAGANSRQQTSTEGIMLDISNIVLSNAHVTGPAVLLSGITAWATPIDATVTPSTAYGIANAAIPVPIGTITPQTDTVSFTVMGGTNAGGYTTGIACLDGQAFNEQVVVTAVGAISGGVQSVTFTHRYPDLQLGTSLWQGGPCGTYYVPLAPPLFMGGWRVAYPVVGATDSTHIVGQFSNGGAVRLPIPNYYNSSSANVQLTNLAISGTTVTADFFTTNNSKTFDGMSSAVISNSTNTSYNGNVSNVKLTNKNQSLTWTQTGPSGTSATAYISLPPNYFNFSLMGGAQVTQPSTSAGIPLEPNNVPWVSGSVLENVFDPSYRGYGFSSGQVINSPDSSAQSGIGNISISASGNGVSGQYRFIGAGNANASTLYKGGGGILDAPRWIDFKGIGSSVIVTDTAPINGAYFFNLGCFIASQGGCGSATNDYNVISVANGAGRFNFSASTSEWFLNNIKTARTRSNILSTGDGTYINGNIAGGAPVALTSASAVNGNSAAALGTYGTFGNETVLDVSATMADKAHYAGLVYGGAASPGTPTIVTRGAAGSTTYAYACTSVTQFGESLPSASGAITTGNATLSSTNYNYIQCLPGFGSQSINVYRATTVGSYAAGLICANVANKDAKSSTVPACNDTGQAAGAALPTVDTSGSMKVNGQNVCQQNGTNCPSSTGYITSLTTTGTSGPATVTSGVLNIPQYSGGGVSSIDTLTGAFTFTGAGVSHIGNAYTFSGTGSGVTSVGLTVPTWLSVAGSPVTSSGTLNVTTTTGMAANRFLATPDGSAGSVSLRAIAATDVPTLNQNTSGTAANLSGTPALPNGTTATTQTVGDNSTKLATTAFVLANGSSYTLPQATTSVLGGVKPDGTTCTTTSGVLTCPGTGGISGLTAGYVPLATSPTAIGNSLLDYGVTTASTFTFAAPVAVTGSGPSQVELTYNATPVVPGSSTTAVYGVNSSGQAVASEAGAAASRVCTAANSVCASSGIANTTTTVGTTAVAANTCSSAVTVTMTGVATTSVFDFTPNADVSGTTGWGSTGGLTIVPWPTTNTLNYKVCNQTASSITPSASVTFNVGAR